tara:strand:- start:1315 stop:1464 length:150 start_codon:yes stop_codon:yes gene_type:complete
MNMKSVVSTSIAIICLVSDVASAENFIGFDRIDIIASSRKGVFIFKQIE